MISLTPAEQMLVAALTLTERKGAAPGQPTAISELSDFGPFYFGMYCQDWAAAPAALQAQGLAQLHEDQFALTETGIDQARQLRAVHPRYLYAYNEFFYRARRSAAHARFCEQAYGRDLCQHGMADIRQIDDLAAALREQHAADVLELGCGNGAVAAYLAQQTGARVTGVDIAGEGIDWAQEFAEQQPGQLTFLTGDMASVEFPPASFDAVVLIDAFYFVPDGAAFLTRVLSFLRPGGKVYVFFSAWGEEDRQLGQLEVGNTIFAQAVKALGRSYTFVDYSDQEAEHWPRKLQAAAGLQAAFEAEDQGWLFRRRFGEAEAFRELVESGCVRRYLYVI